MSPLNSLTVDDAMHKGIEYCEADTPLTEVARLMSAARVHCVAVHATAAGDTAADRVWGIVSDLDLVRAAVHTDADRAAGTLAHTPVITVRESMPLTAAGEAMVRHQVNHVVVVDDDDQRPVGILSTLDVASALAGQTVGATGAT